MYETKTHTKEVNSLENATFEPTQLAVQGTMKTQCLGQTSSYAGTQYLLEDHAMPQRIKRAPALLLGRI